MGTSRKERLERFFNIYSCNWSLVKEHPDVTITPDYDDIFICPTCLKCFSREAIEYEDITLEHVPPESVGGKVRTITCRSCNNTAGSELEGQLRPEQDVLDFLKEKPGSSLAAELQLTDEDGEVEVPVSISKKHGKSFHLSIAGDPKRSAPGHVDRVTRLFEAGSGTMCLILRTPQQDRPHIARLRTAYLWAFSVFGYGYFVNPYLNAVRFQIQNPAENVLGQWEVRAADFPDSMLGVNIVVEPVELQSFLVVFNYRSSLGTETRYGVVLPGFSKPGITIYKWLQQQSGEVHIDLKPIPDQDVQRDIVERPFIPADIWDSWRD